MGQTTPDDVMKGAGLMIAGANASIVVAQCGHCDRWHLGIEVQGGELMVIANFPGEEQARLMMMAMNNISGYQGIILHTALENMPKPAVH